MYKHSFLHITQGNQSSSQGMEGWGGNKPYLLPNWSFQVVSAYHSNLQFSTLKYYRIFLYSINIPNMNYAQTQSVTFSVGGRIYIQQYSNTVVYLMGIVQKLLSVRHLNSFVNLPYTLILHGPSCIHLYFVMRLTRSIYQI